MKLSVIMPVYNVEKYIKRCINSFIIQSNTNFELIIVDDGSKDNSVSIAKELIKNYHNMKIVSKSNGGLSDARNFGLKYASGDYVTFVDSDDEVEFNYVDSILEKMKDNDLIYFGHYVDEYNDDILYNSFIINEKTQSCNLKEKKDIELNNINTVGYAWNKVYKLSIIKNNKLKFEVGTSYVEDIIFNSEYIKYVNKISILDIPLYRYKQYNNSNTLGRKVYPNIYELDCRAFDCFRTIMFNINSNKDYVNRFYVKYSIGKILWSFNLIYKSSNLSDKKAKQHLLLKYSAWIKDNYNFYKMNLNTKEKIRLFLLRYKLYSILDKIDFIKYCILKIKKLIPIKYKQQLQYILSKSNYFNSNSKKIFIFLASNYGNLGDCLITRAQKQFFNDFFPEYEVIFIYANETFKKIKSVEKNISNDDYITFVGGGNFGDLYPDLEYARKFITLKFRSYRKFYFPQTLSCEKDEFKFLTKNRKVYDNPNNVFLFRDKKSYDLMRECYSNCSIELFPDIALYLKKVYSNKTKKMDYIISCMRNDKEKNNNINIESFENKFNISMINKDTQIYNFHMTQDIIDFELDKIIKIFSNSKLVVTDRLHGMILSYIVNTPFVSLDNKNGKVGNVYNEWLKLSNGIFIKRNNSNIDDAIKDSLANSSINNKKDIYDKEFNNLFMLLKK